MPSRLPARAPVNRYPGPENAGFARPGVTARRLGTTPRTEGGPMSERHGPEGRRRGLTGPRARTATHRTPDPGRGSDGLAFQLPLLRRVALRASRCSSMAVTTFSPSTA